MVLRQALAVLDWVWLLLGTRRVLLHDRRALLVENLLFRQHRAAVGLRAGPLPRLRRRDRLFWVLARRLCADWCRHLVLLRPETVLRWHRQVWPPVLADPRPAESGGASRGATRAGGIDSLA